MKTNIHFGSYLAQSLLQLEVFQTTGVKKTKTRFMYNHSIFENRAIYNITWEKSLFF
jgi:hypothetical protein